MEKEKKILKIKCEQNITFPDARKQFEQFNAVQTYASAVKPSTCNKQTQTEDKDTQTDDSFTEYLKQQTASEKQAKKKQMKIKEKVLHLLVQGQHLSQQPWK